LIVTGYFSYIKNKKETATSRDVVGHVVIDTHYTPTRYLPLYPELFSRYRVTR